VPFRQELGTVICFVAGAVAMGSSGVGVLIPETGRPGRDWIAALGPSDVPSGYSGARVITELTRAYPSMVGDTHQCSTFRKPPVLGLAHLEPHKTPVRQPVDERDPSIASNFGRLHSCRRAKLLLENAWQAALALR
jgi:hypothetical protein